MMQLLATTNCLIGAAALFVSLCTCPSLLTLLRATGKPRREKKKGRVIHGGEVEVQRQPFRGGRRRGGQSFRGKAAGELQLPRPSCFTPSKIYTSSCLLFALSFFSFRSILTEWQQLTMLISMSSCMFPRVISKNFVAICYRQKVVWMFTKTSNRPSHQLN